MTKATSQHVRCLVIEDLHVSGMLQNRKLSRAIADVGLSEFRRQLLYKAEAVGLPVKIVSRWYPSSKMCSCCGWIDENQTLSDRMFLCQQCGVVLERDYIRSTVSSAGIDAWGDWCSGFFARKSETLVDEPGTEHEMWLVHIWVSFG